MTVLSAAAAPATAGHGVPCSQPRSLPLDRRGRLRNGARPGDFLAAPRCGARARHGGACRQPAMKNGRCRFHGGKSTGPRTAEGHLRCRLSSRTHGGYSAEIKALQREASAQVRRVQALLAMARGNATADQRALYEIIAGKAAARAAQSLQAAGRPRPRLPPPLDMGSLAQDSIFPPKMPPTLAGPAGSRPCNKVRPVYSPPPPCRPQLGVG